MKSIIATSTLAFFVALAATAFAQEHKCNVPLSYAKKGDGSNRDVQVCLDRQYASCLWNGDKMGYSTQATKTYCDKKRDNGGLDKS
jgi:hypothetical protein